MATEYCNKEASSRAKLAFKSLKLAAEEIVEFDFEGPYRTSLGYPFYTIDLGVQRISVMFIKKRGEPCNSGRYRVYEDFGFTVAQQDRHHVKTVKRLRTLIMQLRDRRHA